MDDTDLYRVASIHRTGSSIWKRECVFSLSSREEDDEEALKWAALEKLPTYDRIRRGILSEDAGEGLKEVNIQHLGFQGRKKVLEKLVRVAEEDNEAFLLKLKGRIDRVGIHLPTIEVRYENLTVGAEAYIGSRGLPTVLNFTFNMLEVSGKVTYNGHGLEEFVPQRTSAYISQHDLHIGEMTVRETLAFSGRCQGVGARYQMLAELSRREKEANIKPDPDLDVYMKAASLEGQEESIVTDYILKILGLEVCANTMVGDQMMRGISGGQKKRVTTGEMLVGPAKALFMDEISTGLDSSTTFQIVNSLRQSIHILGGTAVIALLQPAPETYDLFDDIILLSDGQIVYQGPREHVLEFFESMGFKCPERKGVADFLQEVTSMKDQQQYWAHRDKSYRYIPVKEFADAFHFFHVGRNLGEELSVPFDKSKSHPASLTTTEYGVSKKELLRACFSREWLLMKRNSFAYIFKMAKLLVVGLIAMTVFFRTKMHRDSVNDGSIFMGALFFALVTLLFNGLSELGMTVAKLPVFYKQRDLYFYPSWAYSLPTWIVKIPVSVAEVGIYVVLTYYVIGFDPNAGRGCEEVVDLGLLVITFNFAPNSTKSLGIQILESRGIFAESKWYWIGVVALIGYTFLFNGLYTVALAFLDLLIIGTKSTPAAYKGSQTVLSEEILKKQNADRTGEIGEAEMSSKGRSSPHNGDEITKKQARGKKGMLLPFTPFAITFDNIRYSVDMPLEMKDEGIPEDRLELLKGVSGAFRPGVLTALMGVSGAGKTTLMDVLAGRKTGGYIEGSITISGYPKKQETFARISGYCEQNDIHSPHVTVYESLLYSAWLRLPSEVDVNTRKMFIEEVMELVELTPLRDSLVGLPGVNGLSTEQRKRLTIAVELVANPSIIFMDEPTSGLDARAAAIVMRTVRNTVDTGRTVICTIHQPSIDIFEAFDEAIDGVQKIKDGYNPATWMLEVTTAMQEEILGVTFVEVYKNSDLFRRNKALIAELSSPPPNSQDLYFSSQYSQPFISQCIACLWKQRMSYWRNPPYTAVRLLFTAISALMFGTIFWGLGSKINTQQDLFNAMGSMYAGILLIGVQNASSVQPVVAVERTVFYRERAAGMYSALPYAFAQVLVEIPYILVQTILYGIIVYATIQFDWTAAKFFWYLFFMFFTLLYFTYYGMMAVGLTPNQNIAAIVSTGFYALWNLFAGFVVPRPNALIDQENRSKEGNKNMPTCKSFYRKVI
ncbi:ABC transporter G member 39 [Asimina triloba]